MEFLKRATKVKCIVASVITALALITLIMLVSLLGMSDNGNTMLCFIFTISLFLVLLIWQGVIQIQVFNDYKSQDKCLCADGILNICMGTLIVICTVLWGILQASDVINGIKLLTTDIRVFVFIFMIVLFIWKFILSIKSIKEKRFNCLLELLICIFWLSYAIFILLSMYLSSLFASAWVIIINGWILIALSIWFILYSYVIKEPKYLETEKGFDILAEEKRIQEIKKFEDDCIYEEDYIPENKLSTQEKLQELKNLRAINLINKEDYDKLKEKILADTFEK